MANFIKLNKSFLDLNKYINYTYIEVLLSLNIRVPHLCYHNQLPVSGNCRLCLGIIGADRKPAPLCATSVRPNDIVDYNSTRVRRLRQDVLEFLLINHPMDCPTCDQGGECDLQDYSYNFGSDRSRHTFSYKKTILNKDRGAIVKTVMNRCINCTRCTRFFAEVVGSTLVGIIGRGINSEISSYVDMKFSDCEFSGNVIDLCPVGALTSQTNAFAFRPWNLKRFNSFDILDSLGSNIILHVYGSTIVKITPGINYNLNLNWISDKARYMFDGLYQQRILKPLYLNKLNKYVTLSWSEVFYILKKEIFDKNKNINIGCYFGELLNNETIFTTSKFMDVVGSSNKYSLIDEIYINNDFVQNFTMNSHVTAFSQTDMCFVFGSNLKTESPLLNIRLRKQYLATALSILTFGIHTSVLYPTYFFGFKLKTLIKFIEGSNLFCKFLCKKQNPTFLFNVNLFKTETLYNFFTLFQNILIKNNLNITKRNFNFFHSNIEFYNQLYINMNVKYKTRSLTDLNCLYLLNVDKNFNQIIQKYGMFKNVFTIYQGHHYNSYLDFANLILPSKPAIQEEGSFINANGDVLHITDVLHDDNIFVKDNILILYSVFSTLFPTLKDNLKLVLTTKTFTSLNPALVNSKTISTLIVNYTLIKLKNNILKNYTLNTTLYKFYANDNISLASQLMSNCNKTLVKRFNY